MCFSASASFTASFILLIIGIITARRIIHKRLYYIAAIPWFFSFQQAAEGFVWLSLLEYTSPFIQQIATYIFLFFAVGVWPFWIPFSLMKAEINLNNKKALQFFSFLGAILSVSLLSRLLYHGAQASIANCHISYDYLIHSASKFSVGVQIFNYVFMVTVPFFISTIRYMNYFGLSVFISCLISYYFYYHAFGSVWCFFAAILSTGIYFIIDQEQQKKSL